MSVISACLPSSVDGRHVGLVHLAAERALEIEAVGHLAPGGHVFGDHLERSTPVERARQHVADHLGAERIAVAGAASQQLDERAGIDAGLHASQQTFDRQRKIGGGQHVVDELDRLGRARLGSEVDDRTAVTLDHRSGSLQRWPRAGHHGGKRP